MIENSVSFIMAVFNQQNLIGHVMKSIFDNMSENVKEIFIIIDGCVDNSEKIIINFADASPIPLHILHADNVGEILSCNMAFRLSTCQYSLTSQDDMVITEKDFDKRMMKPFHVVPNLFAVSSRNAQNENIAEDGISLRYSDLAGMDVDMPRDMFAVRDGIIRGQILWDNEKLKTLNYLDEEFAPQSEDDKEISLRAYINHGWLVGAYRSNYISEPSWGATRKYMQSYIRWEKSCKKNQKLIVERYYDYLSKEEKHNQDIVIE